ncbi:MAG: hypothetical protein ACYCSF_12090 [Acidimicrobiales bacterium]
MTVKLDDRFVEVGDVGHGRLVLRNTGPEAVGPLGCGQPLLGWLLDDSNQTVGGYCGGIAGTGLLVEVGPRRATSLPVLYGTASTSTDLGYAVPPGRYSLKVQLPFRLSGHPGDGGPPTHVLTAPLARITVVPPGARRTASNT